MGWLNSARAVGLPSLNGRLPGTVGFSYASFLLDAVDIAATMRSATTHMGARHVDAAQDPAENNQFADDRLRFAL